MIYQLYTDYFAKHKPLRHYTQHFVIGCIMFFLSHLVFSLPYTWKQYVWMIVGTYVADIDGLLAIFTTSRNTIAAKEIRASILKGDIKSAAITATIHHKAFNMLWLHTIVGFVGVLCYCYFSITAQNETHITLSTSILAHMVFDGFDDIYQMGHVNNWLWPLRMVQKFFNTNVILRRKQSS